MSLSSGNGLPEGWKQASLGELGDVIRGVTYSKKDASDEPRPGDIPLLRSGNIKERLDLDGLKFVPAGLVKPDQVLQRHDIVVSSSNSRELVGKSAQLLTDWRGTFGAFCAVIRPKGEINPRYLGLFLQGPTYRSYIGALAAATNNIFNLRKGHLEEVVLPVAPREEQERIVVAVDSALDSIEDALSSIHQAQALLIAFREQTVSDALARFPVRPLSECLAEKLINGRSVQTLEGGFPVLRLTAIRPGSQIDLSQCKEGSWSAADARPFLVEAGDFLVSRGNGSLKLVARGGLVEQAPSPVAFPDTMIRIRADESIIRPRYLQLIWDSPLVRRQIETQVRTTAGIYKINQKTLGGIELPIPSLEIQDEIAMKLHTQEEFVNQAGQEISDGHGRASQLRDSILSAAFAARLFVRADADPVLTS